MESAPIRIPFIAASVLIVTFISFSAFAQCDRAKQQQAISSLGMDVKIRFDHDHVPSSIEGKVAPRASADPKESALAVLRTLRDVYCASRVDDFVVSERVLRLDELGQTDVWIDQTYRGMPVIGVGLRVHLTHDSVTSISGYFRPGINVSVDPVVTREEAAQIALRHVAKGGAASSAVKEVRDLAVFVNDHEAYLAYPVQVDYAVHSDNRYRGGNHLDDVFVSAITGAVVGVNPLIRRDP